jgi:hypothetical protein
MTTLVAWVGVDSRGPASINFSTDSRISWGKTGIKKWDLGRKTFSCNLSSDIFGYVNDVLFPSVILSQIVCLIDSGCLFTNCSTSDDRFNIVFSHIKHAFSEYSASMKEPFSIFHASRDNDGMRSVFQLNLITATKISGTRWDIKSTKIPVPTVSSALTFDGSGGVVAKKWASRWDSSSQGKTSRAVFSGFCDAVFSEEDKLSFGAPQIVSLYRIKSGQTIGFVHKGKSFYSGAEILPSAQGDLSSVEWRNRLFERCDYSGNLLNDAKKHHVPKGLAST